MTKSWLLRLHRWVALLFALPLLGVLLTGLILSFEPVLTTTAITPGSVTVASIEALLHRYDPEAEARSISLRLFEGTLVLSGARPVPVEINLGNGQEISRDRLKLSSIFGLSRRVHERLLLRSRWLVIVSTAAMLVLVFLGALLGWPRLRHTLAGWHKGIGWLLLPLVVLSPLTGLLIALGVTFVPVPVRQRQAGSVPLVEAVRLVGASHDLSAITWIRPQGGRMLARIREGGELRLYSVSREGVTLQSRNWPRLLHEGTFWGIWGGFLNVITSVALLSLLGTGTWLWTRRKLQRRSGRRRGGEKPAPS